LIKGTTQW